MGVVWAGTGEARGGYLTPCIPCSLSKPRWIWASLVGARAVTGPEPGGATGRACLKRVGVCGGGKAKTLSPAGSAQDSRSEIEPSG